MKRSTKFTLAAIGALGVAALAMPVIAQQSQMQHGGKMGGGMGMMMGGGQNHMMAKFDTNKDGTVSPEEMTAGIQAELTTYDIDGDGTLSLEEFAVMRAAHTRPMTVRAFQMHDADGDALVTEAEMAATAAMMQSRMGGQQGGMPGKSMMGNN